MKNTTIIVTIKQREGWMTAAHIREDIKSLYKGLDGVKVTVKSLKSKDGKSNVG